MERYEVFLKPSAVKEIERIGTRKDRRKVVDRIGALAEDLRPRGCEKLTGRERYRVRQGSYRIVYAVDDEARRVNVVNVGHRRNVYR